MDTNYAKYFASWNDQYHCPETNVVREREKVNEPARAYAKDYGVLL
jgi:hypothetical protein